MKDMLKEFSMPLKVPSSLETYRSMQPIKNSRNESLRPYNSANKGEQPTFIRRSSRSLKVLEVKASETKKSEEELEK